MTGSVFIIKGLVKILVFVNLSNFGHQFLCAQKRLPTSKTPCIIPCQQQQSNTSQQNSYHQQATNYQRYPHKSGYTPNIQQRDINLKRHRNPCNRNGVQLRCNICESIYHFEQQCPEVKTTDLYLTHEVILFESDYDHPAKLKNLVSLLGKFGLTHLFRALHSSPIKATGQFSKKSSIFILSQSICSYVVHLKISSGDGGISSGNFLE